ncbi:MAG: coenzyme F420-0:L-glutamate ligase [Cyanobacteria bacterium P01_F01_bin.33]
MSVAVILTIAIAVITTFIWAIVTWADSQPPDRLELAVERWTVDLSDPQRYRLGGTLLMKNLNPKSEATLNQFQPRLVLLSDGNLDGIHTRMRYESTENPRDDNYWVATLIGSQEALPIKVSIELTGEGLDQLKSAFLQVNYIQYGRKLRQSKFGHVVCPLRDPAPMQESDWQERSNSHVMPVRTPLLTSQDDLSSIARDYVKPWAQPGDYLALAETATAIVQGNYRHPSSIQPQLLARTLCHFFPSKTSLCSAYGMQTLIDTSNSWRVAFAFIAGVLAKAIGQSGVFYALAGYQAALIDDLTGTLPPYDQFLVLGPENPQETVDRVRDETGIEVAIVDANDLGEVKILAATPGIDRETLIEALRSNPAGNAAEQTPLVLVRPLGDR